MTTEELIAALSFDEAGYDKIDLVEADFDTLEKLAGGQDITIAARATYLGGVHKRDQIVEVGARSPHAEVRVAAASAASHLDSCGPVLKPLLSDTDVGVQKVALNVVADRQVLELKDHVEYTSRKSTSEFLKLHAAKLLERL